MKPKDFFDKYYHDAVISEQQTGVPALAKLAQAAVESAWGEKAPGNNFFGIKADSSWNGKRQLIPTTEYMSTSDAKFPQVISIQNMGNGRWKYKVKDWFRAYATPAESFNDHSIFLMKNKRYAAAFQAHTPEAFVDAIADAGYATDPHYAEVLKSIIRRLAGFLH